MFTGGVGVEGFGFWRVSGWGLNPQGSVSERCAPRPLPLASRRQGTRVCPYSLVVRIRFLDKPLQTKKGTLFIPRLLLGLGGTWGPGKPKLGFCGICGELRLALNPRP